jgi:hypothetical protein
MSASKLSDERSRALDYYLGDVSRDMPAPEGRSKAVSTDVADTMEGSCLRADGGLLRRRVPHSKRSLKR